VAHSLKDAALEKTRERWAQKESDGTGKPRSAKEE